MLEAKVHKNDYIVKLKGSYIFDKDKNNIYMTIHGDQLNPDEYIFSIVNLPDKQRYNQLLPDKSLLRIPSTNNKISAKFQGERLDYILQTTKNIQCKFKRYEPDSLIVSK